jgi:hypothetical protein
MGRRAMTTGVVTAIALAGGIGGLSSASATPVCGTVSTSGTVIGSNQYGPACTPYPYPVSCGGTTAGVSPHALVTLSYCVPAP